MPTQQSASAILERHYLELRCILLDMAAAFDRMERSGEFQAVANDPRLMKLREGLKILQSTGDDRAERIQMLFSDAYDAEWRAVGG
jgi:hypothetical protein